jgi:hypothetical protein
MAIRNKNRRWSVLITGIIILAGCVEHGSNKTSNNAIKMDTIISSKINMNILASVTWGNGEDQLEPFIKDAPSFGYVSDEQKRKTYSGVLVKADEIGGVHIMKEYINNDVTGLAIAVIHFSPAGQFTGKTIVPQPEETALEHRKLIDYAGDSENNVYVLELLSLTGEKYENRLLKINSKGEILWDVRGEYADEAIDFKKLKGTFSKIMLTEGPKLFIVPYTGKHSIAEIDTRTGNALEAYALNEGNDNRIYINDNGKIARAFSNFSRDELFFGFYNTATKTETDKKDTARFWGDMTGFDNNDNAYSYTWYNGFRKLSPGGAILNEFLARDVIVRNDDQSVYTNWMSTDSLFVTCYKSSGKTIMYSFKINLLAAAPSTKENFRLVHVDQTGNFYFHTGEAPGNAGKIIVVSESGAIVKEMLPPFDLFTIESNFHFNNIHIDPKGNIYLPITDPKGIKIVKFSF